MLHNPVGYQGTISVIASRRSTSEQSIPQKIQSVNYRWRILGVFEKRVENRKGILEKVGEGGSSPLHRRACPFDINILDLVGDGMAGVAQMMVVQS